MQRLPFVKVGKSPEPSIVIPPCPASKMGWGEYTSKTSKVEPSNFKSKYTKCIVEKLGSCLENFVYSTFSGDKKTDFSTFANKLMQKSNPVSALLLEKLSENDNKLLAKYRNKQSKENFDLAQSVIVQCLNKVIGGSCIYEPERFKNVSLRPEITELIHGNSMVSRPAHLNRLLLEDAYKAEMLGKQKFFSRDTKDGDRTRLIKVALSELGHEMDFKVYSNRLPPSLDKENGGEFKNREWLYDLHWYTEDNDTHYQPISLPLVVECEWRPKRKEDSIIPYSGYKFDFQKLLVANAKLGLMIFIIKKDKPISELDNYFVEAIESYNNLAEDSRFLFIAFDKQIEGFHYAENP